MVKGERRSTTIHNSVRCVGKKHRLSIGSILRKSTREVIHYELGNDVAVEIQALKRIPAPFSFFFNGGAIRKSMWAKETEIGRAQQSLGKQRTKHPTRATYVNIPPVWVEDPENVLGHAAASSGAPSSP
jgi:hypothetical protein